MRTHQEIDARSLAMHQLVAQKVRQDPVLFEHARRTLARWRQTVSVHSQPYLEQWEHLFNQGMDASLAVAVEDSERATALRQSSPFVGLLTEGERLNFLITWNQDHGYSAAHLQRLLNDEAFRQDIAGRLA